MLHVLEKHLSDVHVVLLQGNVMGMGVARVVKACDTAPRGGGGTTGADATPSKLSAKIYRGGGGALRPTHYCHMHNSRGCVGLGGMGI